LLVADCFRNMTSKLKFNVVYFEENRISSQPARRLPLMGFCHSKPLKSLPSFFSLWSSTPGNSKIFVVTISFRWWRSKVKASKSYMHLSLGSVASNETKTMHL